MQSQIKDWLAQLSQQPIATVNSSVEPNPAGFWLFYVVVAIAAMMSLYASYVLLRAPFYTQKQKLIQLILVWLLPIVGSFAAIYVARSTVRALPRADRNFEPQGRSAPGVQWPFKW